MATEDQADNSTRMAVNNLHTAAAMLAQGKDWELAGATLDGRPGFYVFHIDVPAGQEGRAEEIIAKCRPSQSAPCDMQVHLGRYEAGFSRLKRAMNALDGNHRRRDRER